VPAVPHGDGQLLAEAGLADPGLALAEQRPVQPQPQVRGGGQALVRQVADLGEPADQVGR
jgi:hypothetical protein